MRKVITYGTFDLLHVGHINLLRRAKALGDYLIVGVTSDAYDRERGKLNVHDTLLDRVEAVKATGLADKVIVEEFEGQKILDIEKYKVDVFAIGSDWQGKFDYLKEYCEVVYLERTRGVSSTQLRQGGRASLRIGIVGTGRIAGRFVPESRLVSGVEVVGACNPNQESAVRFAETHELGFATADYNEMLEQVDAVYVAAPHQCHTDYAMRALDAGVHVLCEKPMGLSSADVSQIYKAAANRGLTVLHGIKTAYCPAFEHLLVLAKSGRIGRIVDVEASFTKLVPSDVREMKNDGFGGSMNELSSYPLLAIAKLLGVNPRRRMFNAIQDNGIDLFVKGFYQYDSASASFKVGLGAKTEGNLVITGTRGYIYVPAPWWKTEYFEMRFEDPRDTRRYYYTFDGDGLRYEILEFANAITAGQTESPRLTYKESLFIVGEIEAFHNRGH